MRVLPIICVVGAFLAGRYHVLWDGSAWVLVPIFGIAVSGAIALAMGEQLSERL
jgi:hypothetical protein